MSDHLRILHVVVSDRFAGVEQFVLRLARAQAADGHQVWVAGGDPAVLRPALRESGIRFAPVSDIPTAVRAIRSARVDIVNTHMTAADAAAAATRMLPRRHRPALIATRHFALPRGSRRPRAAYLVIERMLDAEIAISRAVADAIGVPSTIVHSGLDTPAVLDLPRQRTVLMAQRLQPEKRTDVGIRAFAASGIAADGWRLDIAGIGAERDALLALARRLGVAEQVTFLGFRDDLPRRMQEAGMLLATTPNEGLGLTVLEAMGAGLPVVAADAGGHSELLAGIDEPGLFRPDDPTDAARRLRDLAADPPARDRLGDAERRRQEEHFTVRAQADGTEAVYRNTLSRRQGRR